MRAHHHRIGGHLLGEILDTFDGHPDGHVLGRHGLGALDLPGGKFILVADIQDEGHLLVGDLVVELAGGDGSRHAFLQCSPAGGVGATSLTSVSHIAICADANTSTGPSGSIPRFFWEITGRPCLPLSGHLTSALS